MKIKSKNTSKKSTKKKIFLFSKRALLLAIGSTLLGSSIASATIPEGTAANNGIAIGTGSDAGNENGVAIGSSGKNSIWWQKEGAKGATAKGTNSVAIGGGSLVDTINDYTATGSNLNTHLSVIANPGLTIDEYETDKKDNRKGLSKGDARFRSGGSVAIGEAARTRYEGSVAIGKLAHANAWRTVAIGPESIANRHGAIAIGEYSYSYGSATVAIGEYTQASGEHGVAIGNNANALNMHAAAFGSSTYARGQGSLAAGTFANAKADSSIAISAGVLGSEEGSNPLNDPVGATTTGQYSIAMGYMPRANNMYSTAIGYKAVTNGGWSNAIGYTAEATGKGSNAIGSVAHSIGESSNAIGDNALSTGKNSVAIGTYANSQGISSIAISVGSYDPKEPKIATNSKGDYSIAMGYRTNSGGVASIAIGDQTSSKGDYSTALGMLSQSSGNYSAALGRESKSSGLYSTALGSYAEATGQGSVALGYGASAWAPDDIKEKEAVDSVAIGALADTGKLKSAVALGSHSIAEAAVPTPSYELKYKDANGTDQTTILSFAGTNPQSTVSVGSKGNERTITNVAAGRISATSTDAINGSQLYALAGVVQGNTQWITNYKAPEIPDTSSLTTQIQSIKSQLGTINQQIENIQSNPGTSGGTDPQITTNKNNIEGNRQNIEKNTNAIADNRRDIDTNTKNIAGNTSAINDLQNQMGSIDGRIDHLDRRIDRVGAGAAALAALHPLDFDPDDKWDFTAGYGNYNGADAVAIGAFYRPNEDTMFSIGTSLGGGENMINAGVTIKLGQGNHISTSRVAMAKEMRDMKELLAQQAAEIARLKQMHNMSFDDQLSELFPDIAENHWAYEYVTKIAGNGIVEGYPDGLFKGDRMMTRYEFAAIVYRMMQLGKGANDKEMSKLVKEFGPELKYIRIDTIHKDKDGNPTVQRVRITDYAKTHA